MVTEAPSEEFTKHNQVWTMFAEQPHENVTSLHVSGLWKVWKYCSFPALQTSAVWSGLLGETAYVLHFGRKTSPNSFSLRRFLRPVFFLIRSLE